MAQSPNGVSMTGQSQRRWTNIETVLGKLHVFAGVLRYVYSRPSVGVVLGQCRIRLVGFEPVMGCENGPTLNRNCLGTTYHRPTSCVRGTVETPLCMIHWQVLNGCWPAPAMLQAKHCIYFVPELEAIR